MFPEDDATRVQRKTIPIREAELEDDLVYDILAGTSPHARHLRIPAVFEPCDENVRQGDHAKEI